MSDSGSPSPGKRDLKFLLGKRRDENFEDYKDRVVDHLKRKGLLSDTPDPGPPAPSPRHPSGDDPV